MITYFYHDNNNNITTIVHTLGYLRLKFEDSFFNHPQKKVIGDKMIKINNLIHTASFF